MSAAALGFPRTFFIKKTVTSTKATVPPTIYLNVILKTYELTSRRKYRQRQLKTSLES